MVEESNYGFTVKKLAQTPPWQLLLSASPQLKLPKMLAAMMITAASASATPTVSAATQPVYALIDRVLGSHQHFQLVIEPNIEPLCFRLADVDDLPGEIITVHAQDASLLAAGVGWFLRERANMTIGTFRWGGSRLTVPKGRWPQMKTTGGPAHVCRQVKYSYMMNVCTHSYSLVWYSWEKHWQPFLDFMALRGVNLFLALTGQEEVQYRALQKLGLSDLEIRGWYNGPAFLTWSRGQNEYGAGIAGPLPRSFMRSQFDLQKLILDCARSLGIIGQLPGFQGNVPIQLKAKLADANITKQGDTGWMDSLDPHFATIADAWMAELKASFGLADHWYQLDGYFNGGTAPWMQDQTQNDTHNQKHSTTRVRQDITTTAPPPQPDPLWVKRGAAAYAGLARTDPAAIWSFQGFAFEFWKNTPNRAAALKGFIDSAPKDKFVIIDMDYGEGEWLTKFDSNGFWGTPFVWSKLHNFGGTDGLRGNMTRAFEVPGRAVRATGVNIIGSGFTGEGIDQNPAYYDMLLDNHFTLPSPSSISEYLSVRALRRYGLSDPADPAYAAAAKAWTLLGASVYTQDLSTQDRSGVPHLKPSDVWAFGKDRATPTAKMCLVWQAWGHLIDVASSLSATTVAAVGSGSGSGLGSGAEAALDEPLRYDLIDVGREVLAQISTPMANNFSAALDAKPVAVAALDSAAAAYLGILADVDELVGAETSFLLGPWLAMAREVGSAAIHSDATNASDCTGPSYPTIPKEVVGCAHFYEWNARSQLTTWNPVPSRDTKKRPGGPIDYASKHWNGLIKDYYHERAKRLLGLGKAAAAAGKAVDPDAMEALLAEHAYEFQVNTTAYPMAPTSDALATSKAMRAKHAWRFATCGGP